MLWAKVNNPSPEFCLTPLLRPPWLMLRLPINLSGSRVPNIGKNVGSPIWTIVLVGAPTGGFSLFPKIVRRLLIELHYLRESSRVFALPGGGGCDYLSDPFLGALHNLRMEATQGDPLLACQVDLKNAFWSLRLPDDFKRNFRLSIDGETFAFDCLPFGWQYLPALCQIVLGFLLQKLHLVSVVVLHYLDDFLLVGYGMDNVQGAARQFCELVRREGAIISPKSVLDPVSSIVWLGKHLVLLGQGQGVFVISEQWTALLGLWLRVALLPPSRKFARRVIGRISWSLRPQVGSCPFLAGWWYVMWGASYLPLPCHVPQGSLPPPHRLALLSG